MKKATLLIFLLFCFTLCGFSLDNNKCHPNLRYMVKLDSVPQFPGGEEALIMFIKKNMTIPHGMDLTQENLSRLIGFHINTEGKITNLDVLRSASPEIEKVDMTFFNRMPDCTSAQLNGKAVETYVKFWVEIRKLPGKPFFIKITYPQKFYPVCIDRPLQFEGGEIKLAEYLNKNLNYDASKLQAQVIPLDVNFTITPQGKTVDIQIEHKNHDKMLSDEAHRLFENMQPWKPVIFNGKGVNVFHRYTMVFESKDGKTLLEQPFMDYGGERIKPIESAPDIWNQQIVDRMPSYPGGDSEMYNFLGRNLKYPAKAQDNKIQGRVLVRFVIETDGTLNKIDIMESVSPELDAEAKRVIRAMPKWIPATNDGQNISVFFTVPISFRL